MFGVETVGGARAVAEISTGAAGGFSVLGTTGSGIEADEIGVLTGEVVKTHPETRQLILEWLQLLRSE